MVIEEIVIANSSAVIILLILVFSRLMTRRKPHWSDRLFSILIYIGISCALLETISFLVDGQKGGFFHVINVLSNSLLYACNASVSVLWLLYVDNAINRNRKTPRSVYIVMSAIWGTLILSLIFNIFFGFLFRVDSYNVYHREPAGYIFYAFLILSFIISIFMYIRSRFVHGEAQFFPIWMFLTPVVIACIIQAIWYGIATAWLGCAIGLTGIYVNMQSKMSHVDSLTNLYNRAYVEHKLILARASKRHVYSGVMLDIDYFKNINDKYGHSVGDEALADAANILLTACDRNSLPFRFAGDEFIILVKLPISQKDELEAKTLELIDRVNKEAEKYNASKDNDYKIVFSIGYSIYNPNENEDIFFHRMDEEMYKQKRKHHSETLS